MVEKDKSSQLAAAARLEVAASEFAAAAGEITRPSDVSGLLLSLGGVQSTLDSVYASLAEWHASAVEGVHHGGQDDRGDPANPGWVRAEVALQEAAQYGEDAVAALARAHGANEVALWFDELKDGGTW